MKTCEHCGAKNATRAQFCSTCGQKFSDVEIATRTRRAAYEQDARVQSYAQPKETTVARTPSVLGASSGDETTSAFSSFGAALCGLFVATFRLLARLAQPLIRYVTTLTRNTIVRALEPSSCWAPDHVPNFLYWGVVEALLWRLPFSVIGLVYAVLANVARAEGEFARGAYLAERAKNWFLFDLAVGVVVCVFKNLVFAH